MNGCGCGAVYVAGVGDGVLSAGVGDGVLSAGVGDCVLCALVVTGVTTASAAAMTPSLSAAVNLEIGMARHREARIGFLHRGLRDGSSAMRYRKRQLLN
jgi:hypothetical protein